MSNAPLHRTDNPVGAWLNREDLVGFKYRSELYCVPDIMIAMEVMRYPKKAGITRRHVNIFIKIYGRQKLMLRNDDERWKDQELIPQPVFVLHRGSPYAQRCKVCGERVDKV